MHMFAHILNNKKRVYNNLTLYNVEWHFLSFSKLFSLRPFLVSAGSYSYRPRRHSPALLCVKCTVIKIIIMYELLIINLCDSR